MIERSKLIDTDPISEKQRVWEETLEKVRTFSDLEEEGVDPNIVECVAGFIVNGFNTCQSCGGHTDQGRKNSPS